MMNIYIVRHTSVDISPEICYGQTNVPLNKTFEQEAEQVKNRLKDHKPDIVYSSPLSRCRKLAQYCGYDYPQYHDRLKEIHFGDWEMRKWNDTDMDNFEDYHPDMKSTDGESFRDLYTRVSSFLDELKTKDFKEVIIFAHAGVINCFRVYFGEAKLENTFDNMVDYGAVLKFKF